MGSGMGEARMHTVAGRLAALSPASLHILFGLLLAAAAVFGRHTNLESTGLALVWPAAGIAFLWGLWASRTRRDLLIALTAGLPILAVVNLVTGLSVVLALAVALGSAAQTAVAVAFFRRLVPDMSVRTVGDYLRLGAVALVACSVGALFIVVGSAIEGSAEPLAAFIPWLVRHAVSLTALGSLGIVVAASITARAEGQTRAPLSVARRGEYAFLIVISVILYVATFGSGSALPIAYTTIPAHMWAGLRLRSGWAMLHGLASGAFLVYFTLERRGPFQDLDPGIAAYVAQSFMFIAFSLSAVLALSMDERRRLIDRLYRANEEAKAAAELRDLVIGRMNDGVLVVGADRSLIFQNSTSERWLGVMAAGPGEVLTRDYEITTPSGRRLAEGDNPLDLALQGTVTERMDLNLTHHSGEVMHLSVDALPLPGDRGAVVVLRNVTHERLYQRDLGRFASVVAHDLLTPLTVFDGWLELLEDPDLPPAEREASIGRLQQASLRMRTLIRNLLAYSLAKEERSTASRIDVGRMVDGIIDLRTALPGTQLPEVHFEVDAPHPVYADERLFLQLMENLVGNAMKYGKTDGTGEVTVTTSVDARTGRTLVHVRDNGIGVPEGDLERVFEEFHRSENGLGQASGTGLGLAICRRIAESHGGSISVRNVEEGGAEFTVSLPGAPDQLPEGIPLAEVGEVEAPKVPAS
ncbi:signal transduction histidine kinase [Arthrobacter sp. PL16]|uniref:sensor histidine kinase n=1 Tax=Arthrobacter sp. PL16 TaxID=3071720 RepID=UPI002DFF7B52|nr:signal transduction histidine kinase [Arthrobacter sp. PL16]